MSAASRINMNNVRADLTELVNRTAYAGERLVLQRNGKPVAALVSIGDLEQLELAGAPRADERSTL